jgi:hypothetical protein
LAGGLPALDIFNTPARFLPMETITKALDFKGGQSQWLAKMLLLPIVASVSRIVSTINQGFFKMYRK